MSRHRELRGGTDLPVLLPAAETLRRRVARERAAGLGPLPRLRAGHGVALVALFLLNATIAEAQAGETGFSVFGAIIDWTPVLFFGFLFNILISFLSMALGTIVGTALGLMQVSLLPPIRVGGWFVTQFFRNAPWLVLLFFCMFLLPFEIELFGLRIPFPDWVKAVIGFSLPVMANVSEIVRGAVASIPTGQWESAESLAFSRFQTMVQIILPQCIKRMVPPWMNLYAILTMATVLASVVGVNEMMTRTRQVLAAVDNRALLIPIYTYVLIWFFAYCYPIARWTLWLERKYMFKS